MTLLVLVGMLLQAGMAGNVKTARAEAPAAPAPTFWVDVKASTWITRGHNLYDVEGSLRVKLKNAGFPVVRNGTDPHEFRLKADYRETKGQQFSFDSFGTDINCTIQVLRDSQPPLLDLAIQASSGPPTGVAPYLDALYRFETNPYFFLLGDLVRGQVVAGLNQPAALIKGLERLARTRDSKTEGRSELSGHSMVSSEVLYLPAVIQNGVQELGRLKDSRAVPLLTELLRHDEGRVRMAVVKALGALAFPGTRPALEQTAREDKDPHIRQAAASVLNALPPSSGSP